MARYYDIFKRYLKDRRIAYTEIEDEMLMITYRGEAMDSIPLVCNMDSRSPEKCLLCCFEIGECTRDTRPAALAACNLVNQCAPGVNIFIDDDLQISAMCTVRMHREYFCDDIIEAMNYMSEAVDAVYMQFHEEMERNQ